MNLLIKEMKFNIKGHIKDPDTQHLIFFTVYLQGLLSHLLCP